MTPSFLLWSIELQFSKTEKKTLPAGNLIKYKKIHSEKQHLVNSRYELKQHMARNFGHALDHNHMR